MGLDLFEACDPISDDQDLSSIVIDQKYAQRMEHNKKREALQRLQELKKRGLAGGSDDSEEDSSEEEEEEDDGLVGSGKKELKFYEALVKVKKQDPILLQNDADLFSSDEDGNGLGAEKPRAARKEKPLYLKDVMAKHLIEEGPEFQDKPLKHHSKIYKTEQSDDIRAFLEAEKEAFTSDDGDLIKEKETAGEETGGGDDSGEIDKRLDSYFGQEDSLNESEKFLKNYLRKRMWIDEDKGKEPSLADIGVSEDEDELEKQDKYEAEYNFRYEEAEQGDRVLGHSRIMEGSVRKKTSSRKLQRKSKEERMAHAELERKEELKHLKNLKKKEIQEKLEKIRAIAGIGEDGVCRLNEEDLDEDFDPEKYDRKMGEMYGAGYYNADDADPGFGSGDDDGDLEKPDFDKEDELLGLPKDWDVCGSKDGFASARERALKLKEEEEEPQKEEGKRKRKRKISLKEKVELDKELEEYYKLDYEDTIGDLKTRFKYKPVSANRYGLHSEEILMAGDKDLNQYVSLKKLAPYRQDEWKVPHHLKLKKNLILGGSDAQKVSKKHVSKGGQGSAEVEGKSKSEESTREASALSRNSRRRRRQAELKPSWRRLMVYGKIPFKPQKKH